MLAKAWTVFDLNSNKFVCGFRQDESFEIASMTKIMTMYVCLKIIKVDLKCFELGLKDLYCRGSAYAAKIGGTTAYIKDDLRYSVYDLLVGLMLPSGNDAAIVLAEHFGRLLIIEDTLHNAKSLAQIV